MKIFKISSRPWHLKRDSELLMATAALVLACLVILTLWDTAEDHKGD
jgi:hypothetical protein